MNIQEFIRDNSKPLNEVLMMLAAQIHCDPAELMAYAAEDSIGGYHIDEYKRKWPQGSMWQEEGVLLYVLTRYFKPETIVEIGGWLGCSATHFATAIKANGNGHIISVDNGVGGQPHGALIPDELRQYVTLVNEDGRVFLNHQPPGSIGLMFEDADHSTQLVTELARLALAKVEPGGVLVCHDAMHKFARVGGGQVINSPVGDAVQDGLRNAGVYFTGYLVEPSDCGLAITVVPGVRVKKQEPMKQGEITIDIVGKVDEAHMEVYRNLPRLAADHLAALSQAGNSNIESVSEPPALKEDDTKETPVKKTRKRKPKV